MLYNCDGILVLVVHQSQVVVMASVRMLLVLVVHQSQVVVTVSVRKLLVLVIHQFSKY